MVEDQFDADAPLTQAYDPAHAAAYLGISKDRLNVFRLRGLVEAFSTGYGNGKWRYPVESLRRFRSMNVGPKKKWWDPNKEDLPIVTVARLMGLSPYTIRNAVQKRIIKSLSPLDVRDYMLQYYAEKIGKDLKKFYAAKLQVARTRNKLLTDRLVTQKCRSCGKKVAQRRFFAANRPFKSPASAKFKTEPKLDVARELSQLLTRTSEGTSDSVTESQ